ACDGVRQSWCAPIVLTTYCHSGLSSAFCSSIQRLFVVQSVVLIVVVFGVWRLLYYFTVFFFFSSRRRHTRLVSDWSSDVCSSDLPFDDSTPPDYSPVGRAEWNHRMVNNMKRRKQKAPTRLSPPRARRLTRPRKRDRKSVV